MKIVLITSLVYALALLEATLTFDDINAALRVIALTVSYLIVSLAGIDKEFR